jgi:hypothetical protein
MANIGDTGSLLVSANRRHIIVLLHALLFAGISLFRHWPVQDLLSGQTALVKIFELSSLKRESDPVNPFYFDFHGFQGVMKKMTGWGL